MVKIENSNRTNWLFWACFIALVATSFGFIIRAQVIGNWGVDFNLSETQKGELLGVGLWPFALSIVLFSLFIDKFGYGRAMVFAIACHLSSAIITIFASGYTMLYLGTFIVALGNGAVEAVINPVVATVHSKEKTKWLNILHAGWPGGMVLGGLLILAMGPEIHWKWKVGLIILPTLVYGLMLLRCQFPVHERVRAGISYKTMLQEAGILGALIVIAIMTAEIGRIFTWSLTLQIGIAGGLLLAYGVYVRSFGRPLFIFLLLIMLPLATTELGTDSWITELVNPVMASLGVQAGWVLVYTAFVMMILRFFAGPFVEKLKPVGLLAASSVIAIIGLLTLSEVTGSAIFLGATIYALGKSFFWPTMMGIVAERFPKGGALTLNTISGVGMLSVGVIGAAFLGNIQDREVDQHLQKNYPAVYAKVAGVERTSVFGNYQALDQSKITELNPDEKQWLQATTATAKKDALKTVAVFPLIMLVGYLILLGYFRRQGGYKPVELTE